MRGLKILLLFAALIAAASSAVGGSIKVIKVLPTFLDQEGRIGLVAVGSAAYKKFSGSKSLKVVPAMNALRDVGDSLESIVPHATWPLPTYREMLFVK